METTDKKQTRDYEDLFQEVFSDIYYNIIQDPRERQWIIDMLRTSK